MFKKIMNFIVIIILVVGIGYFAYIKLYNVDYQKYVAIDTIEINDEVKIKDVIQNIEILNGEDLIDTSKLGAKTIDLVVKKNKTVKVKVTIQDTKSPEIEDITDLVINVGEKIDDHIKVSDNSNYYNLEYNQIDTNVAGLYEVNLTAKDDANNETSITFNLYVTSSPVVLRKETANNYYVEINKTKNVVMVYEKYNGTYSKLVQVFTCSAGNNTPLGLFNVSDGYEYGTVDGGLYARYSKRIHNGILFHSVPYYTKPKDGHWDDIEYEEYNKLGELASLGCIRLSLDNEKWIFDHIDKGTMVYIYEDDNLPAGVVKPSTLKIDVNNKDIRGWDPTDPDPESPYNKN